MEEVGKTDELDFKVRARQLRQGWRVLRVEALVCIESSAACSRYSCHCSESYVRTEEAVMGEGFREGEVDAGSPSK